MKKNRLPFLTLCIVALGTLQACKKENIATELTSTTQPPATSSVSDQQKDTALAYSKDIYLWYNQIPASFDARSFTELDKLMTGIRQYSTETGFSQPVDRWSFAIKQTEWNNISSGIAGDFGINVFFMAPGDLRVKSVEKESATISLGNAEGNSSVRCSIDSAFVKDIATLNPGNTITIKGNCTGYMPDETGMGLGSDVVLNRCVLEKKK